ncbi:sterol desaturase family protein [Pseudohaliea sp.]|uniref:sterol desaturase family protein n=1 Tax=Pseudohaliea sp. TaxID=2740289 RepID=UPI0032EBF906
MDGEIVAKSSASLVYTTTLFIFAAAMVLEAFAPRRQLAGGIAWRWGNNFTLGLLSWYGSAVGSTLLFVWLARWSQLHQVGLLGNWGATPQFLVLLASTQLLSYWIHRAFHAWRWLWPLHAVHHSDTDVDVSTTYRHHPLEPLLSLPLAAPLVLLLGVSPAAALAYRLFDVGAQVFSHSNIALPAPLERALRYVILTPDFHRVHHCAEARYTNSNYGSLVPWFDYLFGTARHRSAEEQRTMELGLEYLREPRDSRIDRLLLAPVKVFRLAGPRPAAAAPLVEGRPLA